MAELTNPLFEDEKEFLERQKLEYERALQGDVDEIKEKTQEVGKYALIGAGLLGSLWLIKKAFSSKKPSAFDEGLEEFDLHKRVEKSRKKKHRPAKSYAAVDTAVADDLGFGSSHPHQNDRGQAVPLHERAHIAPDVYHTTSDLDPFPPVASPSRRSYPVQAYKQEPSSEAANLMASAFRSFMQSDTGKMLVAQVTAVLMAYVAKKVGDYLPMVKNPDLANSSNSPAYEPETKDIDFTYHHDEADAPHQPA